MKLGNTISLSSLQSLSITYAQRPSNWVASENFMNYNMWILWASSYKKQDLNKIETAKISTWNVSKINTKLYYNLLQHQKSVCLSLFCTHQIFDSIVCFVNSSVHNKLGTVRFLGLLHSKYRLNNKSEFTLPYLHMLLPEHHFVCSIRSFLPLSSANGK